MTYETKALELAQKFASYEDGDDEIAWMNRTLLAALREASAEGWRRGVEEAATVASNLDAPDIEFDWIKYRELVVQRIRALSRKEGV